MANVHSLRDGHGGFGANTGGIAAFRGTCWKLGKLPLGLFRQRALHSLFGHGFVEKKWSEIVYYKCSGATYCECTAECDECR